MNIVCDADNVCLPDLFILILWMLLLYCKFWGLGGKMGVGVCLDFLCLQLFKDTNFITLKGENKCYYDYAEH